MVIHAESSKSYRVQPSAGSREFEEMIQGFKDRGVQVEILPSQRSDEMRFRFN